MMDEEIRQALSEVREMKQMCGNINMKLTNIVTQRGQDFKKKLEAEYQRGLEAGKQIAVGAAELREKLEYQRGLNDAWEAARKIVCDDELDWNTLLHIFNRSNFEGIFGDFSPSEAIEKLKAYEEKQKAEDKIEAGDEVIYNGTTKCIVVRPEDDERYASLIDSDGTHYSADHRECKKTGRHFDIASILGDMRE